MTNTFAIERDILAAALVCAAKKDARYYLNGVFIEPLSSGYCVVATDGTILFAGMSRNADTPTKPIIIPRDACEAALKTKRYAIICEEKEDGTYILADSIAFSPVNGTFPIWRNAVPRPKGVSTPEFGPLSPDVLGTIAKSAKSLGIKQDCVTPVFPHGPTSSALFTHGEYLWVAAPLRVKSDEMVNACWLPNWFTEKEETR